MATEVTKKKQSIDGLITKGRKVTQGPVVLPTAPGVANSVDDYAVFAAAWQGDAMFTYATVDKRWGGASYTDYGIVPIVAVVGGGYNGYRPTNNTNYSDPSAGKKSALLAKLNSIPSGYRFVQDFYWECDLHVFKNGHFNYYKGTADGTSYAGITFLPPWTEQNAADVALSVTAFLQWLKANSCTVDYFTDDRESINAWYLDGWNTITVAAGVGDNGIVGSDARYLSSIAADTRFTTKLHDVSGLSFADSFLANYKAISQKTSTGSAASVLAPLIGVTTASDFRPPIQWWVFYNERGATSSQPPGSEAFNYDLFHHVVPAWNAVVVDWHYNHIVPKAMLEPIAAEMPAAKLWSYETFPMDEDEARLYSYSNRERVMSPKITGLINSHQMYGDFLNILFRVNGITKPSAHNGAQYRLGINCSGYRLNPETDHEKYDWADSYVTQVDTKGSTDLVRYPSEIVIGPGPGYAVVGSWDTWNRQLSYKTLIHHLKLMRHSFRSDPDLWQRYAPWVSSPALYGPWALIGESGTRSGEGYWYELMYHALLHGANFLGYYEDTYNPTYSQWIQTVLDEWRTQSYNSKARPCSNASGSINEVVDRIVMCDAFTQYVISGGKLLNSGLYLWRITLPPEAFDGAGNATLRRIGNADLDIPQEINITAASMKNSRGAWVIRQVPGMPQYEVV